MTKIEGGYVYQRKAKLSEPSGATVRSKDWLAANLRCRNGDTLKHLNDQKSRVQAELSEARERLRQAEITILAPLRCEVETLEGQKTNLSCRLNIWWNEHRQTYEAANDPHERTGAKTKTL